jgi:hypothetical protein
MKARTAIGSLALAGTLAATGCAVTAHATAGDGERRTTTCGWLRDGVGHGSALSAKPGAPVTQGQIATVQSTSNTWSVCEAQNSSNIGKIWLESSPGWCLADYSGYAHWEGCGGPNDEEWTVKPQSGGGYEIRDTTNGVNLDICASDGVGSKVIATGRQGCSTYHRTWLFNQVRKTTG